MNKLIRSFYQRIGHRSNSFILIIIFSLIIGLSGCLEETTYYMCTLKLINDAPVGFSVFNITQTEVNLTQYPDFEVAIYNLVDPSENITEEIDKLKGDISKLNESLESCEGNRTLLINKTENYESIINNVDIYILQKTVAFFIIFTIGFSITLFKFENKLELYISCKLKL